MPNPVSIIERKFQLQKNQTNWKREITAGLTTFAAMAYILAVNPGILSTTGMDAGALVTATALVSALMTFLMAWMTNYPLALAPGMGLNAFFAFTICQGMGIPWQGALGLVFCSGILFLILSISGIRRLVMESIPKELKIAISCGIGLFITFIGLKNGGIVVSDPNTFVTVGDLSSTSSLLVLFGIISTAIMVQRKVRAAVILGILAVTFLGLFLPQPEGNEHLTMLPERWISMPASLKPTWLQLDIGYVFQNLKQAIPIILALLFVDLFDTMGTLIGVSHRAGLLDSDGRLPKANEALAADASASIIGSCLGSSTVTCYIESAAGVEAGGRPVLQSSYSGNPFHCNRSGSGHRRHLHDAEHHRPGPHRNSQSSSGSVDHSPHAVDVQHQSRIGDRIPGLRGFDRRIRSP